MCDRQEDFRNGTVALRNALEGFNLRPLIPFGEFSPLDNVTGAILEEPVGYTVVLLDELAKRAGFTWRDSFGIGNISQDLGYQRLNEALLWSVKTYDVSVAQWGHDTERMNLGVSFPEGWFDSSIIMVGVAETDSKLSVWSFLEPFEWTVWVMILVTFVVAGLVYFWMERYNEKTDRDEKPVETIYFAALSFAGDISFQPSTD